MSYCVNCGVELDVTASACPLCNTKVYNPNQPVATDVPPPYATVKGHTEPVKMKEFTILMSIVLVVTCVFGEEIDGKVVQKGTLAKMARGEMVRFLAENEIDSLEGVKNFHGLGYEFSEELSGEKEYIFIKKA